MVTNQYEPNGLFPGLFVDSFKEIVSDMVSDNLKAGQWSNVYDTTHNQHIISPWTISNVILPAMSAPEPSTLGLKAMGLLGLGLGVWRKRRASHAPFSPRAKSTTTTK